jgi:hypothetical protein
LVFAQALEGLASCFAITQTSTHGSSEYFQDFMMTPENQKPAPKTEKKIALKKNAKTPGEVNKSAEIRKLANSMKAKGEKPRPVVIIEMLKKQGVEVSSPQVSMVLKKMGFRPRKRRKTGLAKARAISATGSKTTSKKIKVEDLVKAQKVAEQMGGIDRALAALQALKGFE